MSLCAETEKSAATWWVNTKHYNAAAYASC